MRTAYIGLFTLTDAQRARELLDLAGIRVRIVRMPSGPGISCSFGLKLRERDAEAAAGILRNKGLRLGKTVFRRESGAGDRDLF